MPIRCILATVLALTQMPVAFSQTNEDLVKACPAIASKMEGYKTAGAEIAAMGESAKNDTSDAKAKKFCSWLEMQGKLVSSMRSDLNLCLPSFEPLVHESIAKMDDAIQKSNLMRQHFRQTIGCP